MLDAGWTAVGEFHYLGLPEAFAAAEAAEAVGIGFVCLHVAYARGGLERMRQPSVTAYLEELTQLREAGVRVGVAPHSVRACPRDWLEELGRYAAAEELPLHVHANEQPREIEECLAEHGMRPIELLAETRGVSPSGQRLCTRRTWMVPSSTFSPRSGATVCVCPTTEADLGDGFVQAVRMRQRSIPFCIGSDSNIRIDPLEELRELEGIARRQSGARGVFTTEELLAIGGERGAAALDLASWPETTIDIGHASLAGVEPGDLHAALIAGASGEAVLGPPPLR